MTKSCYNCQTHANSIYSSASSLQSTVTPWPFSFWALDMVGAFGELTVKVSKKANILNAYFTKWAEIEAFVEIKASTLCQFFESNNIARFGVPTALITENGLQFISNKLKHLFKKYKIALHNSLAYYLMIKPCY